MTVLFLSCLLALSIALTWAESYYCFGKDTDRAQIRNFTSRTAYQFIKCDNIENQYQIEGCVAEKIWIFHRHGTRLPSKGTIKKAPTLEQLRDSIINNYRTLNIATQKNALCKQDFNALQEWKWNASITPEMGSWLTGQGYDDLVGTAKIYQKYFPKVLTKVYNSSYYLFRHTNTKVTMESFKAFTEGLFGGNNIAEAKDLPKKDFLLSAYDHCHAWGVQNFDEEGSESAKYRVSAIWNQTLAEVSARLGFQTTLNYSVVSVMYDICRYEQAWHIDKASAWCAAFTPAHVSVLEYEGDLMYYYKTGYGYEANSRVMCRIVKDMISHLSSKSMPNVIANFGHSSGLLTFITALGMLRGDTHPLLASNYQSQDNRKWRTSHIDPFAANFVAVKYQCDTGPVEKEKVIFFLNQDAVNLDWCPKGVCNWYEVKKRYSNILNADCESYYCADGATATNVSLQSLLLAAFVYFINLI